MCDSIAGIGLTTAIVVVVETSGFVLVENERQLVFRFCRAPLVTGNTTTACRAWTRQDSNLQSSP